MGDVLLSSYLVKNISKSINIKEKPQQFASRFGWVGYSIVLTHNITIDVSMSTFSCTQGKRRNKCVIHVSLFTTFKQKTEMR